MNLTTRNNEVKTVSRGDLCWCDLDKTLVRFWREVDSTTVEVIDVKTGKTLADWRHPSQVHPL